MRETNSAWNDSIGLGSSVGGSRPSTFALMLDMIGTSATAHLTIQFGDGRVVLLLYRCILRYIIFGEEVVQLLISAHTHRLNLPFGPGVHLRRSNKTNMDLRVKETQERNSKAAMLSGTLEANKRSISDRCPLGTRGAAISTHLIRESAALHAHCSPATCATR